MAKQAGKKAAARGKGTPATAKSKAKKKPSASKTSRSRAAKKGAKKAPGKLAGKKAKKKTKTAAKVTTAKKSVTKKKAGKPAAGKTASKKPTIKKASVAKKAVGKKKTAVAAKKAVKKPAVKKATPAKSHPKPAPVSPLVSTVSPVIEQGTTSPASPPLSEHTASSAATSTMEHLTSSATALAGPISHPERLPPVPHAEEIVNYVGECARLAHDGLDYRESGALALSLAEFLDTPLQDLARALWRLHEEGFIGLSDDLEPGETVPTDELLYPTMDGFAMHHALTKSKTNIFDAWLRRFISALRAKQREATRPIGRPFRAWRLPDWAEPVSSANRPPARSVRLPWPVG